MALEKGKSCSRPCPAFSGLEARVDNLDRDFPDMRKDVKDVLTVVTDLRLAVAALPNWENVKALDSAARAHIEAVAARVAVLESNKAQMHGAANFAKLLWIVAGGFLGWWLSHK